MSNNSFLKSKEYKEYKESKEPKEANNRFNFLNDDDSKSSFKESNKSKRKNVEYEASQNSFTQPCKHERTYRDRDRYGDHRNYRRNNYFSSKQREPSPPPIKVTINIDANNTELFPDLTPIKDTHVVNIVEPSTKFKDILKNVVKVEKSKKNPIFPGWVQLSLNQNRQTVIEYGPKTAWMIKQKEQLEKEQLEKEQEDDPNYIMFYAIEAIKKNCEQYEHEYDEFHGEGTYAERFRLPPVYGPEYDTESEEEEEEQEESEDDVLLVQKYNVLYV